MILTCEANAFIKSFTHPGIIPTLYFVDVNAVAVFFFLKTGKHIGDRAFGGLHFLWYGNSIPVIPDKDRQWYLHHAGGINRFPEMAFGSGCIANGTETNFVTIV